MKQQTIRLSIVMLYTMTSATLAMNFKAKNRRDVCVSVKNLSKGLANSTYDIYVQVIPTLDASQQEYKEVFIPYGRTKLIDGLSNIDDIKIRGSSIVSYWTYNKNILHNIKEEMEKDKNIAEKYLQLLVTADIYGFYITYYNWVEIEKDDSSAK